MIWQADYVLTHAYFLNNFRGKGLGTVSFSVGILCVILGIMTKKGNKIFGSYLMAIGVTVLALGFLDLFAPALAFNLKINQLNP